MTEEDYRKVVQSAADAEGLARDERFQRFMRETEDLIVQEWKRANNGQAREDLHAEVRALGKVMQRIKAAIQNGHIAKESERSQRQPL